MNTESKILENNYELYFCPNGNSAQRIGRNDFSEEKKKAIKQLHVLDKRWNAAVPIFISLWLLSSWFAIHTNILVFNILCCLVAGLALNTLGVFAHESTHNLFTHNSKVDRWIGFLCGVPLLLSSTGYRLRHPLHHKKLHTREDPDEIENITTNSKLLSLLYAVMLFVGAYLFLFDVPVQSYRHGTREQRISILIEYAAILAMITLAWILLPLNVMVEGWLIPLLIAVQIANIRGMAEHGFTSKGNEMIDSRTVLTNPVLSLFMCNINYHLEHHLYPGVPWYNLPKLHQLLKDDFQQAGSSVYTSYFLFFKDAFKAMRSGVIPSARLIPAHLREEICL